jgi:hypothetical protein
MKSIVTGGLGDLKKKTEFVEPIIHMVEKILYSMRVVF